jgi:hypothetical protein
VARSGPFVLNIGIARVGIMKLAERYCDCGRRFTPSDKCTWICPDCQERVKVPVALELAWKRASGQVESKRVEPTT